MSECRPYSVWKVTVGFMFMTELNESSLMLFREYLREPVLNLWLSVVDPSDNVWSHAVFCDDTVLGITL